LSFGAERGGSDWKVKNTNIFIEVTGPNIKIGLEKPLWIRPDKIHAAREHPERDTWVVHCTHDNKTMRVIYLDQNFFREMDNNRFKIISPFIRGTKETYLEVPAHSEFVESIGLLVTSIRENLQL